MDAHVGRSLFDKLIGNTGLLAGRTRVLVTHNLAYLHRVDRVLVMDQGRWAVIGRPAAVLTSDWTPGRRAHL